MASDSNDIDLKPTISEEALEEAKDMVGVELRTNDEGVRRRHSWNREARLDNIRHFAKGYGDDNPLYTDPSYAKDTKWGSMLAPPTWLYTVDSTTVAPKLRGIQWIYGGTRFDYERPVERGDVFTTTVTQTKVEHKTGETVQELVLQEGEIEYTDQNDELVATATGRTLRIPRRDDSSGGSSIHQERDEKIWSEEEINDIEERILAQSRRGSETRYWDTVSEGDELEPRLKGPLSVTDELCWYQGYGGPPYFPHELGVKERDKHPYEAFRRDNGVIEHPAMGHIDPEVAKGVGVPRAYDIAPQRISWLVHMVTDWMSDDGFVKTIDINTHKLNYLGDLIETEGLVDETYVDEETQDHLVDIKVRGTNQEDDLSISGLCTVKLPASDDE